MLPSALGCQTVFRVSKFQGVNDEAKTIQLRTLIHEQVLFLRAVNRATGRPENKAIFEQTPNLGERLIYLDIGVIL
jgi:hypothetical protein